MSWELVIRMADDLDKSLVADETVTFSLRDSHYVIDLAKVHVAELEEALAPFIAAARREALPGKELPLQGSNSDRRAFKAGLRAWAKETKGIDLKPGGYIPRDLTREYAEHLGAAT